MKRCYMCRGDMQKRLVDVNIEGVIIKDVLAEVCERCGEQYFDTNTSTFLQNVARYVTEQRRAVISTTTKLSESTA